MAMVHLVVELASRMRQVSAYDTSVQLYINASLQGLSTGRSRLDFVSWEYRNKSSGNVSMVR